jgi:hypothetical protein
VNGWEERKNMLMVEKEERNITPNSQASIHVIINKKVEGKEGDEDGEEKQKFIIPNINEEEVE